jgi:O-antigen/teichoic acid export membrane protein
MLKLLAIGSLVLLLGLPLTALFGRAALTLIYRPEYGQHQGAFQCMVAASGVGALASFLGYGVTATRSFRIQLPLTGASAVATAAVTVVLVPARGILGAAIALLASALVLAGGYALVLFRTIARAKRAQQPADGHSEQDSICPAIVDGCMQTRS